jgi:hypothetical protein
MWSALALAAPRQDNLSLLRAAVHPTSLIGTWGQTHQSRALLFNLAAAPRLRRPLIISFSIERARGPVALWPSWEADARAHASERASKRRQNAQLSHVKYALGKCVNHVFKLSALFSAFSLRRSQPLREMDTHSLNQPPLAGADFYFLILNKSRTSMQNNSS